MTYERQISLIYEAAAQRLKAIVVSPSGNSEHTQDYVRARAAALLAQVQQEIDRLKQQATMWAGPAFTDTLKQAIAMADQQARDAGIHPEPIRVAHGFTQDVPPLTPALDAKLIGSFNRFNTRAVEILARDAVMDLHKAANAMGATAQSAIRRMAATGVTNQQVNEIIAGRHIIEGQPVQAIRDLRIELEKVHGKKVTVPCSDGGTRTYDTGYYADLVASSKAKAVNAIARDDRFQRMGLDLCIIHATHASANPCQMLVGHIFSRSGKSTKYKPFSSVNQGQPPYKLFHPHCHKIDLPYIEGLSKSLSRGDAQSEAA